ncbi:MAG: flagellar basal body rod protein FlgB [Myxococcales bacterium]|nr:flagellar basal body rod protein FlgB [Myxococcales bacterium]
MSGFPDRVSGVLARALALRLERQHLLAGNIANANTPGYVPVDMRFDRVLESALQEGTAAETAPAAAPAPTPEVVYDPAVVPGLDGNAVALDRELAKLAENSTLYHAANRALQKKLGMIRYAVGEGGAQ